MLIDKLNINSLRVFERVYQTRSMTTAAKNLGLTQSGVSQHIKNLEKSLNITLFDRLKHRLIPTKDSEQLATLLTRYFRNIEHELVKLAGRKTDIKGEITIGLPLEFGNNFVLPLLTELGRQHPEVTFSIKYGIASEMNALMLSGEIDFSFIDQFSVDAQIKLETVWHETICLCANKEYLKKVFGEEMPPHELKTYDKLDYVDYVKGAPVLRMWFEHHLKKPFIPNIRAALMDVQGMKRIITSGLGAGVLPLHVVNRSLERKDSLVIFPGKKIPILNEISLAFLETRTLSTAASYTKKYLLEHLPKVLPNYKPPI
jgi:DNA-binding transcriptional LysR family regulator